MNTRWLIGLASGASTDSVDAVLLELQGTGLEVRVRPVYALHQGYPRDLRELLVRLNSPSTCDIKQVSLVNRLLGETFATAARQVADRASFSLQHVQGIGLQEHIVWHEPDGRYAHALGLGMAAVVAEQTGVTTVSAFGARDMAAGGQAVPVGALADYLLFRHQAESRALLHLGGNTRVVFVPAGGRIQDVVGYEAGPCNLLLDGLMRRATGGRETFDPGGRHAVQGRCIETLMERWLAHPYLQRRPPKSMPPHAFGEEFVKQTVETARQNHWSIYDVLCTATHFVARHVANSLRRFLPDGAKLGRVLLSGGGVRNGLLLHVLGQQFAGIPVETTERCGIPPAVRKPLAFGVLAALTIDGVPANVPSATGAAGTRLLGSMTPGCASNWARCLGWMAELAAPPSQAVDY
jgi:anhydro-N-acetylmuramic acid kinase